MKQLVIILALLLLTAPAWAQPAMSAQSSVTTTATTTTCTISSFTVPSGTNTALIVRLSSNDGTAADRVISSVTWNTSESLTAGPSATYSASGRRVAIYRLVNPTATTADVVVTFAGTNDAVVCQAMAYENVDQTTPFGDTDSGVNEGSTTSASLTLTTTAANSLVIDAIAPNQAPTVDSTRQVRFTQLASGSSHQLAGSEWAVTASAANFTPGWTFSAGNYAMVAAELLAAAQPGGNIAFDAVAYNQGSNVTTTVDVSLTVGSGSNRIVLCGVGIQDATSRDVTSVSSSVDGAFTAVASVDNPNRKAHLYYLLAPTSGAHTISIDPADSNAADVDMICASFSGVHQTDPLDGDVNGTTAQADAQTSSSVAQASATDNALAVDFIVGQDKNLIGGAGQTVRATDLAANRVGVSTEPKATAGTITMTWTFASQDYATVMAVLRDSGAAPASTRRRNRIIN